MGVCVLHGARDLRLEERPPAPLGPDQGVRFGRIVRLGMLPFGGHAMTSRGVGVAADGSARRHGANAVLAAGMVDAGRRSRVRPGRAIFVSGRL